MHLSDYGTQMTRLAGVHAITLDIEKTVASSRGLKFINLSTGNPNIIPEVAALWRREMINFAGAEDFAAEVCQYGSTRGYQRFLKAIIDLMNTTCGLKLQEKNLLVTSGSQQLSFYASNLFGGKRGASRSKVLFPMSPEYSGYLNMGLDEADLISPLPLIEILGPHSFKYKINFDRLKLDEVGLLILSRPCNPSGNVITNQELRELIKLTKAKDIPLVIDSAYAPPIPNLCFTEIEHYFDDNVIQVMSLSKAGLPGLRVGVAISREELIEALRSFHANACLKTAVDGQAIAAGVIASGELVSVCKEIIKPYYQRKLQFANDCIREYFPDHVPYYVHETEGTFFKWIWFKDLPVTDFKFYQMMRDSGVIVIPGQSFFFGIKDPNWKHQYECLRLSLTAPDQDLETGLRKIGEMCRQIYG